MDEEDFQTFDDGKTRVSGELREDKVCWTAGDNPWIETCRECFDERTREHGKCFDDECNCWCMSGKQWPIWALFGLTPPEGSAYRLASVDEHEADITPVKETAPVRHRSPVLLAGFILASLALVIMVTDNPRNHVAMGPGSSAESVASEESGSTVSAPDLHRQAVGAFPPDAGVVPIQILMGGLKMPDKPRSNWLRPGKDGICRNPKTGEEVRTQAVIRGSCWEVMGRLPGETTCPNDLYDPPPEVLNDKARPRLHTACFRPWGILGSTLERDEPESSP
jgi:hypothetical protein